MINLPGVLTVRLVAGRYGYFRVGRLLTGIGEFAVKDAVLDQYDEGRYEGVFGVSKIYPSHYSTNGRLIIDVRAELKSIALININPLGQTEPMLEQDPIETEATNETETANETVGPSNPGRMPTLASVFDDGPTVPADAIAKPVDEEKVDVTVKTETEPEPEPDTDAKLFGMLWPLSERFKLDPTVDRNLFRQQRDRLRALGYDFKPVGQLWVKNRADAVA